MSQFLSRYFRQDEKVAVFIDGANFFAALQTLEMAADYRKLREEFNESTNLLRIIYYTALQPREVQSPLRKITDWLQYNNYTLVSKEAKEYYDENGRKKIKSNMDIEIALDMLELAPHVEHLVLFSGDGDFTRLIDSIQRKGRKVTVACTLNGKQQIMADILRRQADQFMDISEWASIKRATNETAGGAPGGSQNG